MTGRFAKHLWCASRRPKTQLGRATVGGSRVVLGLCGWWLAATGAASAAERPPLGPVGSTVTYTLKSTVTPRATTVRRFRLKFGEVESRGKTASQWLELEAEKQNSQKFRVWLLAGSYPNSAPASANGQIIRYLLQEGEAMPKEFVHRVTGDAVLPATGAWEFLWPKPLAGSFQDAAVPRGVTWLGHDYSLDSSAQESPGAAPPAPRRLELLPDVLVGVPSNSRTKDDQRRWDGSDYEMVRLTRADYAEMIRAGMNCFRVDAEQAGWLAEEPVFVWGIGGSDVPFPECLFRSTWIGPALFLDEPAVHTRDQVVRPRLAKEQALREAITPQFMFQEFTNEFHRAVSGAPWSLIQGLRGRPDVDLGAMNFPQRNLYSWETMIASAVWELTGEPEWGPRAIVFEPPGRVGSRRTLPEINMVYGCQLSPENPANFAGLIYGFLRGAARAAKADWGVSIYGAVDRADSPWLLTHAYDEGATHFFFWDNYQLACVPYRECLALAQHLRAHIESHPTRELHRLKHTAETVILLPPGYNLGHVHLGRGNLWGLGELNLERTNRFGLKYRQIMANFFIEVERCLRLAVGFDLLWDLDGLRLNGYREVVRVGEDGTVQITADGRTSSGNAPRLPERPTGRPPLLEVELSGLEGELPHNALASARVSEGSAPIYYTTGTDRNGIYQNAMVLWELFGPQPADYHQLTSRVVSVSGQAGGSSLVEARLVMDRPGRYRLRAATTDLAGRSTVVWKEFKTDR